jgi:glycosyltransferase involved in cell wall biosynthesis
MGSHNLPLTGYPYPSSLVSAYREKIVFVTELSGHGDEGMRNWIKMADRALAGRGHQSEVVRLDGDPRWSSFLPGTLRALRLAGPDVLLYVPYSGLTSKALLRHLALRAAAAPRLDVLVTLQSDLVVRGLPRKLSPTLGAFASERLRDTHRALARDSCVLPPAVNLERFRPSGDSREAIRAQLDLANDKPMVLHVGHLRRSRGLAPLAELAASGAANVVMIASTATEPEAQVESRLRDAGVLIRREFLPSIERWYQAADVYLFPVTDLQGSIEIPLTVLEAMACGTAVASAPFGGLPSFFASTEALRFAPATQLVETAKQMLGVDGLSNRTVVEGMNEDAFADVLEGAITRAGVHA